MEPSDPVWYEALQSNPLGSQTVTPELKARIKSKALTSRAQGKRMRFRWLSVTGIGVICLTGAILIMITSLGYEWDRSNQGRLEMPVAVSLPTTSPVPVNVVLLEQNIGEDIRLVFSRDIHAVRGQEGLYEGLVLKVEEFRKDAEQWTSVQSASALLGDPLGERAADKILYSWFELANIPVFIGIINDPQVHQVQIVDDQNQVYPGKMIPRDDGYPYWFIHLPAKMANYRVEGIDRAGNVVTSETVILP